MENIKDLETFSSVIRRVLDGSYHDVTLLVEGEEFPIYKGVLANWSNYFKELFKVEDGQSSGSSVALESCSGNSQDIVEIKDVKVKTDDVYVLNDVKADVFKGLLHYLYSGTYEFQREVDNQLHALKLTHLYNLESLESKLVNHLVKSITFENFVDIFNLKTEIQNDQLEDSCLDYLKKNAADIAKSDTFTRLTLDSLLLLLDDDNFATVELDIFRAAEKWVDVNKPNEEVTNTIVKKIRLATISQEDLFVVVGASEIFPSIDLLEPLKSIAVKDVASTNFRQTPTAVFPVDKNVAHSSLGAKLLTGSFNNNNLISGINDLTTHRVGGNPDCITVQLEKPFKINHLKINLFGARTYQYHIEVSVDGVKWCRIFDYSNFPCSGNQSLRFNAREVKFIKLTGVNCTELTISFLEALYSTSECELLEGIPVASTNVTLTSKGAKTNGVNQNCIDGNEKTFIQLNENSPLLITLPQPHWVSSLRILIIAFGNNYLIESSSDGVSWQPVCDEVLGDEYQVRRKFEFSRRVVLQFRITMKKINPNNNGIHLYCFESSADPDPPVLPNAVQQLPGRRYPINYNLYKGI